MKVGFWGDQLRLQIAARAQFGHTDLISATEGMDEREVSINLP
jgi:hypothetical protein